MTKEELLQGKEFVFESERDFMEVSFSEHLNRFIIWFNCKILADPKTFKSLQNKVNHFVEKHNLQLCE